MYPTRRMILVIAAGIPLAVLAALVSPGLWLIGAAWILLSVGLFLLDALMAPATSGLDFALHAPGAIGITRRETGSLSLAFARSAPSRVELAIDTGNRLNVVPGRQTCKVRARSADASFTLVPLRRGEGRLDRLWTRWQGPLGLVWRQRTDRLDRSIAIVPDIAAVKDEAVRLFQRETANFGLRAQQRFGQGAEFNALKEFAAGMDRRTIDWKQTAKHGKPLAREYQAEDNLHIVFALDTGRLMCEPLQGVPRIDRAIQALLLLSFVALRLGDRVGLFAFDEKPVLGSGTVAGPNAFTVLQRVASKIDYSTAETNFTLGLTQLAAELEHRSIVIVFTDFSDTTSAELMIENVRRLLDRHNVLFVAFRDEELETMARQEPETPADVARSVLADAMLREREAVTMRLKRLGVDIVDAPVDRIGTRLLDAYLAVKHGRG